ncbi:gaf domain nucleotide-binding protein [Colletotrichum incanum]|nr:gaf domain nucleotide-binding protein [Colletotrichum incanum]
MFNWDKDAQESSAEPSPPTYNLPLDPQLRSHQLCDVDVQCEEPLANNEVTNARGDYFLCHMNIMPSLPSYPHNANMSLTSLGGGFQLDHEGTSGRKSYDRASKGASSSCAGGTDEARIQDSANEILHAKPLNGSTKRRAREPNVNNTDSVDEDIANTVKRQRNTIAARRYRQKGRDRIAELESALKAADEERGQLKLQLARKEAEVDALKEILRK